MENDSTGSPKCIIDYMETKHAKLLAHQQAKSGHLIKGHYNSSFFLLEFLLAICKKRVISSMYYVSFG